jgi:hypothetical protein
MNIKEQFERAVKSLVDRERIYAIFLLQVNLKSWNTGADVSWNS